MIDFVPLIDSIGEPLTVAFLGFALAFSFGILAERTGFCTRSAVLEIVRAQPGTSLAVWLSALGGAILLVQSAIAFEWFSASESRYFSPPASLAGPIIGGVLFGVGMALARGCTSRLLVLGATGNLRALTAIAFTGIAAYATMAGALVPAREFLIGLFAGYSIQGSDVFEVTFGGAGFGMAIGLVLLMAAFALSLSGSRNLTKLFGGVAIGTLIAGAWIATYELTSQLFDPIAVEGLSFVRPTSFAVEQIQEASLTGLISMDGGLLMGTLIGAFVASVLFGTFRLQTFKEQSAPHFSRYVFGGLLMGFGGVMAGGCTVGAGFSGGSVLAISAITALVSMIVANAVSELVIERFALRKAGLVQAVPAE